MDLAPVEPAERFRIRLSCSIWYSNCLRTLTSSNGQEPQDTTAPEAAPAIADVIMTADVEEFVVPRPEGDVHPIRLVRFSTNAFVSAYIVKETVRTMEMLTSGSGRPLHSPVIPS